MKTKSGFRVLYIPDSVYLADCPVPKSRRLLYPDSRILSTYLSVRKEAIYYTKKEAEDVICELLQNYPLHIPIGSTGIKEECQISRECFEIVYIEGD